MAFSKILPYLAVVGTLLLFGCGREGQKPISENLYFGMKTLSSNFDINERRGGDLFWSDGRITEYSNEEERKEMLTSGEGIESTTINYNNFRKNLEESLVVSGLSKLGNYPLGGNTFGEYPLLEASQTNPSNLGGMSPSFANAGSFESNYNGNSVYGFSAGNNSGLGYSASSSGYNSMALNQNEENSSNATNESQSNSSKVPEPETLTLFGIGALASYISRKVKGK